MLTSQDIVDKFYHAVDTTHRLDVQRVRQWLGVLRARPAEEVFQALFGVFTNESRPHTRFLDQEYAGAFLFSLQPPCPSDLTKTIRSVLGTWDVSVEQLPLYFVAAAGDAEVRQALAKIELESLSDTERKGLETFRWWLAQHRQPSQRSKRRC
jgi:hypothetical protein